MADIFRKLITRSNRDFLQLKPLWTRVARVRVKARVRVRVRVRVRLGLGLGLGLG